MTDSLVNPTALELISTLDLQRHPEGGWYRETYRAGESVPAVALPERFGGSRPFCTAIYFLLEQGDISALHRIKSDEIWHFYAGSALTIHQLTDDGRHSEIRLGPETAKGERFQAVVPGGAWFGAEAAGSGSFALVGCTVAPGFDFADFEMGDKNVLLRQYPHLKGIITRLTH